eukprot:gb/GECH01014072.1/.p1 GENE.gb/GECH01014072.1/~~gb/GECH01014072.1/.p1  ORF type:complete len:739 (+),score=121.91 gb/GECH01014072.1/:1-2217(+)
MASLKKNFLPFKNTMINNTSCNTLSNSPNKLFDSDSSYESDGSSYAYNIHRDSNLNYLEATLDNLGAYEKDTQHKKRQNVIDSVEQLLQDWVAKYMGNIPTKNNNSVLAKILPFGSYFLKAHCSNADIDVVCMCCNAVNKTQFFTSFKDILSTASGCTQIHPIPDALFPVIKIKFCGIHMDLSFAQYPSPTIPTCFKRNTPIPWSDELLEAFDEYSRRSLQGRRECEKILELVPNVEKFRYVLRCIKIWAKRRGVYKNVMGYPGGFSYSVMVAAACRMLPQDASPQQIINHFFTVYQEWMWPTPVSLTPIPHRDIAKFYRYCMPVLGPLNPHINTTHTVSLSNFWALQKEMHRAKSILDQGNQEFNSNCDSIDWQEFFRSSEFFFEYDYYIRINVCSANQKAHVTWRSFTESRIRYFMQALERSYQFEMQLFPEPIHHQSHQIEEMRKYSCPIHSMCQCGTMTSKPKFSTSFFLGVNYDGTEYLEDMLRPCVEYFTSKFCRLPFKSKDMFCPTVSLEKQQDLSSSLTQFQVLLDNSESNRQHQQPHNNNRSSDQSQEDIPVSVTPKSDTESEISSGMESVTADIANSTDSNKDDEESLNSNSTSNSASNSTADSDKNEKEVGIWIPAWKKRLERDDKEQGSAEHSMPVSWAKKKKKRRRGEFRPSASNKGKLKSSNNQYRSPRRKRRKQKGSLRSRYSDTIDDHSSSSSSSGDGNQYYSNHSNHIKHKNNHVHRKAAP